MPKVRIVHKRKIKEIRELSRQVHVKGFGKDAEFVKENLGYAALLEPGYDLFFLGVVNPGFQSGQTIKLVLEGVIQDASPSRTAEKQPD